jgi:hypothetical protein
MESLTKGIYLDILLEKTGKLRKKLGSTAFLVDGAKYIKATQI